MNIDGWRWWTLLVLSFWMIVGLAWCAHAEPFRICYLSGRAVLATGAKHATWQIVNGRRCWFAGRPDRLKMAAKSTVRIGARSVPALRAPKSTPSRPAVPLPLLRPLAPAAPVLYCSELCHDLFEQFMIWRFFHGSIHSRGERVGTV
jgi:hypothetical protein